VDSAEAIDTSIRLARREGIFTGITGGATLAAAIRLCEESPEGTSVLCMLPDTGERYLSTPLFDGIVEEMDAEELEIARSTPNHRFDKPIDPLPELEGVGPTAEAAAYIEAAVREPAPRVLMFALTYCEFCWSLVKLFKAAGVPCEVRNLDSNEIGPENFGASVRKSLFEFTGSKTLPQVFVGGEFIGGCEEILDGFAKGGFQERLRAAGIEFDVDRDVDPGRFLPKWLHSRKPA
jgi:cysteine synthase A